MTFDRSFLSVLVFVAAAAPTVALAQPANPEISPEQQAVIAQMVDLNKKALTDHAAGMHAEAQSMLGQALVLAETNGLGQHDMAARTHVHLGIVAITGLHRRDEGLRHFAEAQRIKPGIKLTKTFSTRALDKDFRAARNLPPPAPAAAVEKEEAAGKDKEAAKADSASEAHAEQLAAEEPDLPMNVPQPLYCPTPIEGPPQSDVKLHCLTQADVQARKIVVFYRPGNKERFTAVTMRPTKKGWFSAIIPGPQVTGRALQFYFEARGDAGRLAAANGKFDMPNEIVLKEGAAPVGVGALAALSFDAGGDKTGEEDTPLQLQARADERAAEERAIARRVPGSVWVGLGLGTGWGWHMQLPLERHTTREVTTGFSPAGLGQALPELGYQLTPRLALSIQGRHQYIPTSGSGDPEAGRSAPQLAHAVLLRMQYALAALGDLQVLGTAAAGYGSALRMKVNPAPQQGLVASDTVVAGPVVAGPGLGLAFNFTRSFLITVEARVLAGLPNFGAMGEASAGAQYAF